MKAVHKKQQHWSHIGYESNIGIKIKIMIYW